MDKASQLSNQAEEQSKTQLIIENKALNEEEENVLDHFISNMQIDEEEQKIINSKEKKLLWKTEKENKNEEIFNLKKGDMRKKTREKQKENKNKKSKEKYNMLQQLTEGI